MIGKQRNMLLKEIHTDQLKPYVSKNETGTLPLSPYTSEWDMPGFKDVSSLVNRVTDEDADIKYVPTHVALATQYHMGREGVDDPVFPELEEKQDLPVAFKLPDGYYHFVDGHHRLETAIKRKSPSIRAWVFDLT